MGPEILFRGKRMGNGEWVYGWYCKYAFGRWPIKSCIIPSDQAENGCIEHVDVDPATVGQYTGLTDKNGAKVFKDDICRCRMMNDYGKIYDAGVYVVEWYKENAMFTLMSPNEELEFGFLAEYEVIGNIHDNPELLEVQNETI